MLSFIAAVYNEEQEIDKLLSHVYPWVDGIYIVDDESTDSTPTFLQSIEDNAKIHWKTIAHTGLPETVKNEALQMVPNGSWVLMLDADERLAEGVLASLRWTLGAAAKGSIDYTHFYFQQLEIIDGQHVRTFQKSKLFKKEAIHFSTGIHEDDRFDGEGLYKPEWVVYHRKTWDKQKQREAEYLVTYDKLLAEGKIDEGRRDWLRGLHYFK
jgi:glycosyltransferase involved in cell wall biosynthesis